MSRKNKTALGAIFTILLLVIVVIYLRSVNIPVLQPAGPVASKERRLIIEASLLSLVVVIPVFAMLIGFAWHYREGNKKSKYSPDMDGSRLLETIWWGVPIILIAILAAITWRSSHQLDPFKKLSSSKPPITIQVIALQWKWLFIYPSQGVATLNYIKLPVNTPIEFQITSDAPMNSFWIPQLGGQIYAMSGMATQLHLEASRVGDYYGESANISGQGFSDMHFIASATSTADFDKWLQNLKNSQDKIGLAEYRQLSTPSIDKFVKFYSSVQPQLFQQVVAKYESPIYLKPGAEL